MKYWIYIKKIIPFISGVCLITIISMLEYSFFPVLDDFTVSRIYRTENSIVLEGYMTKVRNCKFAGIVSTGTDWGGETSDVPIYFRDSKNHSGSRPLGKQGYGPWILEVPVAGNLTTVTLDSIHRCHPAWSSTTRLTVLTLKDGRVKLSGPTLMEFNSLQ